MRLLSETDYQATFREPMQPVEDGGAPFDFWAYFDRIPKADFQGHDCSEGQVVSVYRSHDGAFEHVLVRSTFKDVLMVLVLDLGAQRVHGHYLLDMGNVDHQEGEPELWGQD